VWLTPIPQRRRAFPIFPPSIFFWVVTLAAYTQILFFFFLSFYFSFRHTPFAPLQIFPQQLAAIFHPHTTPTLPPFFLLKKN